MKNVKISLLLLGTKYAWKKVKENRVYFWIFKLLSKRRLLLTFQTMHPHCKESIPHYYYILTSYDSSTLTTTITMDDKEDENAKMFYMASMFWLHSFQDFTTIVDNEVKSKSFHRVHTIPKWYTFHWGKLGHRKKWPKEISRWNYC